MLYRALSSSESLDGLEQQQQRIRRGCCGCCGFGGSTSVIFAGLFTLVSFILNIIPLAGTGDIFYAGWDISGGDNNSRLLSLAGPPHPGTPASLVMSPSLTPSPTPSPLPSIPNSGLARLTIKTINFCSTDAGDTFCTDFFASRRVSTSLFPGGSALVSVARQNQLYFGGALALGVVTVVRLIVASCKAGTRGGGEVYCTPMRVSRVTGLSGVSLVFASGLGAFALKAYSDAAGNFFTLSQAALKVGPSDWSFEAGWQCGAAAVGLNCAAALLFLTVSARNRREARREREGGRGGGGGGGEGFFTTTSTPVPTAPPPPLPVNSLPVGLMRGVGGGGTSGGGGPAGVATGGFYPPPPPMEYAPPALGESDK